MTTYNRDIFVPNAEPMPGIGSAAGATIAGATWRDLRAVAGLQRRAFRPPLAYGLTTLAVLWLLPNVQFLVARDGCGRGGMLGCAIGDRIGAQSRVINICVDPAARRQGIGGQLMAALEARLPVGNLVLMVEESNGIAQELYRGQGYSPVGISREYYGRGRNGIWMKKTRVDHGAAKVRT